MSYSNEDLYCTIPRLDNNVTDDPRIGFHEIWLRDTLDVLHLTGIVTASLSQTIDNTESLYGNRNTLWNEE